MISKQTATATAGRPTFGEAFRFWLKLGLISFGGPTGQIAIMQTELVDKRRWRWVDRPDWRRDFGGTNLISRPTRARAGVNPRRCMLLPGPEAQQLAIYIGWLLH